MREVEVDMADMASATGTATGVTIKDYNGLTYRPAWEADLPGIFELLEASRLGWPGPAGSAYVCKDPNTGEVLGVMFKTVCFHVEPFAAKPGRGVSATILGELIAESFKQFAAEIGHSITVYCSVQNNDKALEAAAKSGLVNTGLILHERTFDPPV